MMIEIIYHLLYDNYFNSKSNKKRLLNSESIDRFNSINIRFHLETLKHNWVIRLNVLYDISHANNELYSLEKGKLKTNFTPL